MDGPRLAKDIMVTKLVTLSPHTHVFDGIRLLLKHEITGAPVVEDDQQYLGVFSEKCCMGVIDTHRSAGRRSWQRGSVMQTAGSRFHGHGPDHRRPADGCI